MGGYIDVEPGLTGYLRLDRKLDYLTAEGSTLDFSAGMVVVRDFPVVFRGPKKIKVIGLRHRYGDDNDSPRNEADCIGAVDGAGVEFEQCSLAWGLDETASARNGSRVIYRRCIMAEPLGDHAFISLVDSSYHAIVESLMCHANGRMPSYKGTGSGGYVANNIIYNQHGDATRLSGLINALTIEYNLYITGADTAEWAKDRPIVIKEDIDPASLVCIRGNEVEGIEHYIPGLQYLELQELPPHVLPGFTPRPVSELEPFIVANAGAFPRDAVDERVIRDLVNRTGRHINSQTEVGGFPPLNGGGTDPSPPPPPPPPGDTTMLTLDTDWTEPDGPWVLKWLDDAGTIVASETGPNLRDLLNAEKVRLESENSQVLSQIAQVDERIATV